MTSRMTLLGVLLCANWACGTLGAEVSKLDALAPHFNSPREYERLAALRVLAALDTPEAANYAVHYLETYSNANNEVLTVLAPLFQKHKPAMPEAVAKLLREKIWSNTPTEQELQIMLQDKNETIRIRALDHMRRTLNEKTALELTKDVSPAVRAELADILGTLSISDPYKQVANWARPLLHQMAEDKNTATRCAALGAMGKWTAGANNEQRQQEKAMFKAALQDTQPAVCLLGLNYFQSYPEPEVFPLIEKLTQVPDGAIGRRALLALRDANAPHLADIAVAATSSSNPSTRLAALETLADLAEPRLPALAAKLAGDDNYTVRECARKLLNPAGAQWSLESLSGEMLAKLPVEARKEKMRQLAYLDPQQRLEQYEALFKLLTPVERKQMLKNIVFVWFSPTNSTVTFLLNRLKDTEPSIRAQAFRLLASTYDNHGQTNFGTLEALEALHDGNPAVVEAATEKLENEPYDALRQEAAKILIDSPNPALRQKALIWAKNLCSKEILLKGLCDKDERVRLTAALNVYPGVWDDPELAKAICDSAQTTWQLPAGVPRERAVIDALCAAAPAAKPAQRRAYFAVLARLDDEPARQTLRGLARHNDQSMRWAVLDALAAQGDTSDMVLDHALARLLTSESFYEVSLQWPGISSRLLERLETFKGLADAKKITALKAEIEKHLKKPGEAGGPR